MQFVFTTPCQPASYQTTAKDFLEKYAASNNLGIAFISDHYHPAALFTIHLHDNSKNLHQLYEVSGYSNFKNKLADLCIHLIQYQPGPFSAQPVSKKSILISFCGQVVINGKSYMTETVLLLRINDTGSYKIANHILNFFLA